ncbi:MAG: STAS domain-containing protein [Pirellulales bacterium]|nr:STAS domain-containing protein [Pirellulales bacterium]
MASDEGQVLRLRLAGRVTQDDLWPFSDPLHDMLGEQGYARQIVVSLADVEFIDSSGISWLLVRHKRFRQAEGRMVLHSVPPAVSEVLQMLRLDLVFHLAKDEAAALRLATGGTP